MMSVNIISLTLIGLITLDYTSGQSLAPDNLVSTLKIVVKSCYVPGINDEKTAWRFIGCYDHAPGKQQFFTCQKIIFNGRLFNSVRNSRMNCQEPWKIPKYARCIMSEFRKVGLDMNVAVRKLNACQLAIFR